MALIPPLTLDTRERERDRQRDGERERERKRERERHAYIIYVICEYHAICTMHAYYNKLSACCLYIHM